MTKIVWDKVGERLFRTGCSHGVLYRQNASGIYNVGYAWNGLVSVSASPTGAEATPQYADNIIYVNLVSAERFEGSISAFMYPDAFAECDGTASPVEGLGIGQQTRKPFGLAYRTLLGNDLQGQDYGYELNLVYGALAAPSERENNTVNDSPEAMELSWDLTTTPVEVPGFKPAATLTLNSTKIPAAKLLEIENILYGTAGQDPRLPLPAEIISILSGSSTEVEPVEPTYNSTTKVITIPTVTGVEYLIDGEVVSGTVTITKDTVVTARPTSGYKFPEVTDDDWFYNF